MASPVADGTLFFIRWLTIFLAIGVLGAELYKLWVFYDERLPQNHYSTLRIVAYHIQTLTWMSLVIIAFLIVIRSKSTNAMYVALFLACYCALAQFDSPDSLWANVILTFFSIVTGILFILSMQYFPVRITTAQVATVVRPRLLRWYLQVLLTPRNLWIFFVATLIVIAVAGYQFQFTSGSPGNLLILLTGFGYLFTSFKLTSGIEHARILWLFWGLFMIILAEAIYSVIFMYAPTPGEAVQLGLAVLYLLILFFSFVMSFFFADAFNTGIFVRKTAVNAMLFLLVVFVYNTLEHYVLHWISHTLHLSNAVISSLASGFIVLCISPLHHQLTHFLTKKLKGKEH